MRDANGELASATLAQLYLEQGHTEHARSICREVLAHDPTNGHALLLERRLRVEPQAQLAAHFVSDSVTGIDLGVGQIELTWSIPRELLARHDDARLDVVVAIAVAREAFPSGALALRYTSVRCRDLDASARLDVPLGPASAAVALMLSTGAQQHVPLAELRRRPALRVLAVAESLSW